MLIPRRSYFQRPFQTVSACECRFSSTPTRYHAELSKSCPVTAKVRNQGNGSTATPSDGHAQEQPPLTDTPTAAGPLIKHHQFEANPAKIPRHIFSVFFSSSPIHANNELAAVETLVREFQERDDAVNESTNVADSNLDAVMEVTAYPGFKSLPMTSLSKKTKRARSSSFSATKPRKRAPPA